MLATFLSHTHRADVFALSKQIGHQMSADESASTANYDFPRSHSQRTAIVADSRYFGADRLHLSEHGHRRLAGYVLEQLGIDFEREWLEPLPGFAGRPGWRADMQWLMREVLPVAMSRTRNRLIGRSPGDGFRAKRPELLPMTALEGAQALP